MADLQARIGPKVTNLTWKRPGGDIQSPSRKNTLKWSQTRQGEDEKDVDGGSFSSAHASSSILSSPTKSKYRNSLPRRRDSSGQSLLSRMGLSSEDGASEKQQSLLARVGTTEDTPPNIRSTRDRVHVPDSNGYYDTANSKHASPQPSLPASLNDQGNALVAERKAPDDRHSRISHINSTGGETKYNDGLVVKPSITTGSFSPPLPKSILQASSKSNYSSNNTGETSRIGLEENLVLKKTTTVPKLPPSQEQDFEDGELVDLEPLPSQQVREFLLPLVLENAAHRVKEGDNDLTQLTAHSVLSDEVCSSFMDQMKEVRAEMYAHKNRSSTNLQMQLMGEKNIPGVAYTPASSKLNQALPVGPPSINLGHIITSKYMPSNGKITTKSSSSFKEQPISALSSHSQELLSPSNFKGREPGSRQTPSPERRNFHDHDWGRRYSPHRERFGSHSPSRYSRDHSYHRPFDSSRGMVSRSPIVTSPDRRRSPSRYFRDRALRESPEVIPGRRSVSPPGANNHSLQSHSRGFERVERPGNVPPDSPRSPVYHSHFGARGADKVVSSRRPSFTRDRGLESTGHRRDSCVGIARSGSEFARRSASPRQKQERQFSAERPLPQMPVSPRSATPNPYCQSSFSFERPARSITPNPYYQSSFEPERRWDCGADHMESVNSGVGSMSTLSSRATGSHHPTPKSMIDNKDMQRVNEEVGTPKMSDEKSRPGVLPCHNVPGVWFAKVALGNIGILECSFEVDDLTVLNWNLRPVNVNHSNRADVLQKEKLQLHVCCFSQKDVQSVMDSLEPYATPQDVASALLTIENVWPTPGHLIIMVNPQDKHKRVWLPDKLESPCLPVCIEDYVVEGQNIVQFIQLSDMSERMFVLFATTRPLSDELQHDDDDEGFVLAPLQNTIDGGQEDGIGFDQVTISDLK